MHKHITVSEIQSIKETYYCILVLDIVQQKQVSHSTVIWMLPVASISQ